MNSAASETIAFLESLSPAIVVARADREWGTTLELLRPQGADYQFLAYVYEDGEPQVGARLVSAPEHSFWSQPFEAPDFSSKADQISSFQASLRVLLTHPTRITYRRKFLVCSFVCEALVPAGWQRVGGSAGYFRLGNFRLPRGLSHEFVWRSAAPAPPAA